jgi:hypothetical protein
VTTTDRPLIEEVAVADRLAAIVAHLGAQPLPPVVSVSVRNVDPAVLVQTSGRKPADRIAVLLAWADTLATVRAEAWLPPTTHSLHIMIFGTADAGLTVEVFTGIPTECADQLDVQLEPDQHTEITLGRLRRFVVDFTDHQNGAQ